jgi:hypothetical protein
MPAAENAQNKSRCRTSPADASPSCAWPRSRRRSRATRHGRQKQRRPQGRNLSRLRRPPMLTTGRA